MINYMEKFVLKEKKAVVAGGVGLIGREIVTALAQAGAFVVIADTDEEGGQLLAEDLKKRHFNAAYLGFDITDLENLEHNINTIDDGIGGINIWVNSAYPRTLDWGTKVEELSLQSWRQNIDMQLNSYALACKYAAERMKANGGSIINMGSVYGIVGGDFTLYEMTTVPPVSMIYSAIKGGVVNLTRYLASYFGSYNIRVNALCPGGVFDNQDPIFVENYSKKVPMRRMANAEEVASATLFLASDAASYVTGTTLVVDGGWTAI